jgi:PAS domain S-box-containing protein
MPLDKDTISGKELKAGALGTRLWFGFAVAIAAVGAGVLLRSLLDPVLGAHSPFITFFPAVAIAVFFGRAPAGLLATFLSMLAGDFLFVAPRFVLGTPDKTDAMILAVFLLGAGVIIWLGETMHRAHDRAEALQRETAAAEERARQIVETANEGIWILDAQAKIVMVNPRLRELLGYNADEMTGRLKWDFLFPEDVPMAKELFERRRHGISDKVDLRFRSKAGGEVWTVVAATPRFDSSGKFAGALDMFTDISARKRLEQELENKVAERTARLQDIVQELEVFSYSIAHDLRAPLRAMQGISKAVIEDFARLLPPEGRNYLERVAESAKLLDRQILNVLEYSRLLGGELPLEEVDLNGLIADILVSYPDLEGRRQCIHLDDRLPAVRGNRSALTQVVSNLLNNAVKFVDPARTPEVRIRAEATPSAVRIIFKDNGIGISKKGQQKIFGLFQRLQPVGAYEGTGIGLAIVKKAVERMGGRVGVSSEVGQGSEFWVELALANGSVMPVEPRKSESPPAPVDAASQEVQRGTAVPSQSVVDQPRI